MIPRDVLHSHHAAIPDITARCRLYVCPLQTRRQAPMPSCCPPCTRGVPGLPTRGRNRSRGRCSTIPPESRRSPTGIRGSAAGTGNGKYPRIQCLYTCNRAEPRRCKDCSEVCCRLRQSRRTCAGKAMSGRGMNRMCACGQCRPQPQCATVRCSSGRVPVQQACRKSCLPVRRGFSSPAPR